MGLNEGIQMDFSFVKNESISVISLNVTLHCVGRGLFVCVAPLYHPQSIFLFCHEALFMKIRSQSFHLDRVEINFFFFGSELSFWIVLMSYQCL